MAIKNGPPFGPAVKTQVLTSGPNSVNTKGGILLLLTRYFKDMFIFNILDYHPHCFWTFASNFSNLA